MQQDDVAMQQGVERFPLLPTTRWLVPIAIVVGLAGLALSDGRTPRLIYAVGTALVALLWAWSRWRRPVLIVDGAGYRVEVAGRLKLKVRFAEVRRARAVPAEQAMYVDCGDPARNLLL